MNRLERSAFISNEEALNRITRRTAGIRRILTASSHPSNENLRRLQQELFVIRRNYERLQDANVTNGSNVRYTISQLIEQIDVITQSAVDGHESEIETAHSRFVIDKVKLQRLIDIGFSVRQISRDALLGRKVHHNTIHNFILKNDMCPMRKRYTTLQDDALKEKIREINNNFPNSGVREVVAHLKQLEPPVILQRTRCAELLAEIDRVGTVIRWSQAVHRRQYSVPTPNSLWHLDSHHGLIRYMIFI